MPDDSLPWDDYSGGTATATEEGPWSDFAEPLSEAQRGPTASPTPKPTLTPEQEQVIVKTSQRTQAPADLGPYGGYTMPGPAMQEHIGEVKEVGKAALGPAEWGAIKEVAGGVSKAIEPVFGATRDFIDDALWHMGVNPAQVHPTSDWIKEHITDPMLAHNLKSQPKSQNEPWMDAFSSGLSDVGEAVAQPENAAFLPVSGLKTIQGLFGASIAANLPESIEEASRSATVPEAIRAGVKVASEGLMAYGIGKHLARSPLERLGGSKTPTTVETPAQPGTAEGPAASEGSIPGEEHVQPALDNNRSLGLGHEMKVVDSFPDDPEHIRVFRAEPARADGTPGGFTVSLEAFKRLMEETPPEKRAAVVAAHITEEGIHSTVTNEEALDYLNSLTAAERAAGQKLYLGDSAGKVSLTPGQLGHELIRQRLQRLKGMKPTEIAEVAGREKWGKAGLEMLGRIIRRARELVGTKAAGRGKALVNKILERHEENIQRAAESAENAPRGTTEEAEPEPATYTPPEDENQPFSIRRSPEEESDTTREFEQTLTSPTFSGAGGANRFSAKAGMGAKSIADLNAFLDMRNRLAAIVGDKNQPIEARLRASGMVQLPREAAETATKTGSWETDHPSMGVEGQRPLDWRNDPKVADWLRAHGKELGIALPKELTGEQPASIRRKGQSDPGQEEFSLPRTAEKPERPSAGELGAVSKAITPEAVEGESLRHLSETARPSFATFAEEMKRNYGNVQPGQLREAWQDAVWKHLTTASGEDVARLRDQLALGREFGNRPVVDPEPERKAGSFALKSEFVGEAKDLPQAGVERQRGGQNYRNNLLARIGQKLIGESQEGRKAWSRKEVTPEDVGTWRETSEGAYVPISGEDVKNPQTLGRTLTEGASVERSTRQRKVRGGKVVEVKLKAPPVSVTKRLTAVLNPRTSKVELVSTYRDGRRGTVLLDPASPGQTHAPLDSMLKRYRPIASVLLDEPVQNFRQTFDSVRDFEDRFGQEAKARVEEAAASEAALPTATEHTPETPAEWQHRQPVTGDEAAALFNAIEQEAGVFDSPEDVKLALPTIHGEALSAAIKLAAETSRQNPGLSAEEVIDRVANQLYENHSEADTFEDFQSRTIQQGPAATGKAAEARPPTLAPERQPARQSGARELTLPRDIAPTTVRPDQIPPEEAARMAAEKRPAPPVPEGTAEALPTRRLTPEEQEFVKAEARKKVPPRWPQTLYRQLAERKVPKEKYSMGKAKAVERTETPETPPGAEAPASIRRLKEDAKDHFETTARAVKAILSRRQVKQDVPRLLDGAEGDARLFAGAAREHIALASEKPLPPGLRGAARKRTARALKEEGRRNREAGIAYVASGVKDATGNVVPDAKKLATFQKHLDNAKVAAESWATGVNAFKRREGRRWLKAIEAYQEGLNHAANNWNDPAFIAGSEAYRKEIKDTIDFENANGATTQERENYIPGLWEGAFWNDNTIAFGTRRLLGANFREPKKFSNPYAAIEAGPYYLASRDLADLALHRILTGHRIVERGMWMDALKGLRDPDSGLPVAVEPKFNEVDRVDPVTGKTYKHIYWSEPGAEYALVYPTKNGKPIAVRRGFEHVVSSSVAPSAVREEKIPLAKDALIASSMLKHGVVLILDTFHPGRVYQYGLSLMGWRGAGWRGGESALRFRPTDLDAAVERGHITQQAADWAKEPMTFPAPHGRTLTLTRQQVAHGLVSEGLNASKITDALYRDAVQHIPFIGEGYHKLIGPYNKLLFDRFMPGLIVESAVHNLERMAKENPGITSGRLAKDVVRDINTFYGNLGRQGFFRSATFRDLAQITLLAPLWQEGLLKKEAVYASRLAGAAARPIAKAMGKELPYRQGLPALGTLGNAMTKGLGTYLVLSQMVNLVTRGKPTWKNPEKDHKLDAWIPTPWQGKDKGYWLSPLAVFGEVSHDLVRLYESKPKAWDAITQFGENRLGPMGKMEQILRTGISPQGEKYSTTAGVLKGALGQLAPAPIAFGGPARALGHALAPGLVSPNPPGTLGRQLIASTTGIKMQQSQTAVQQAMALARDFMQKEGLVKSTGWAEVQTDEPSYTKLRNALRADDLKEARAGYQALLKTHTPSDVAKAMNIWAKRGFTGSQKNEQRFTYSLSDQELDVITKAKEEKREVLNKFLDFYLKQ